MKATYKITLDLEIVYNEVDLDNIKSDREMGVCIGEMIADEAVMQGGTASFDVIESELNVN